MGMFIGLFIVIVFMVLACFIVDAADDMNDKY